ncbi:undecaprenyldiphospho-muramoylpentapeptide beta-N-acetylglucosaminyltransferase [Geotalea sp. SG265]|uniref:undecaprenyldiphospho-muramoylpentapeptide beta-N-acetylglucosaminyltransferase n=1 Tax=Geotalea sp. SG265 TaxID=2922867 RepID=UPI001FAF9057|nr:undecaprenyldiphospho-muramoylpentapeptide beta-N-acetylglucosaminyltransferase [Geotalea sp. SG265]
MRLVIAGGGTGGHLFPGIAVAEEFLARDKTNEVLFIGTERGIEARLLPKLGYRLECISASGLKGQSNLAKLKSAALLLYGYSQSRKILKEFRPDLVLGVGGYASAPVVLSARGLQIRRFIHEQNAIPGLTNKVLARIAGKVFISIEESRKFFPEEKTILAGNPLRKEILWNVQQEKAQQTGDTLRLLVFGGSAGAHRINTAMMEALPHLAKVKGSLVVTHQTGEKDCDEVKAAYQTAGFTATVSPFIDNMAAAYGAADFIVCRAGATTLAEVAVSGKACIFIPYPHAADDHQRRNAEALLKKDAGFMILERELTGETLAKQILELMEKPDLVAETAENIRQFGQLDAARVIVDEMTGKQERVCTEK